jgi:excinuclease ABC subunit A
VRPDTVQSATDAILSLSPGTRLMVSFPLPRSARVTHALMVENLRALGFVRVLADGEELHLDDLPPDADLTRAQELLVVVDRLRVDAEERGRLADSLQTAFSEGEGEAVVVVPGEAPLRFSESFRCPEHPEITFLNPTPQLFSFNNPYGSCPECTGFGAVLRYDPSLIVPNPGRSIEEGAVDPWRMPRYETRRKKLDEFARKQGVSSRAPWDELPESFRHAVIHGAPGFQGVLSFLEALEEKRYKQYIRVFLRQYQSARTCPVCGGSKLRPEALRVRVAGRTIAEIAEVPVGELRGWVENVVGHPSSVVSPRSTDDRRPTTDDILTEMESEIAANILKELTARLGFLDDVGLGYLTLERQTRTLSGGETSASSEERRVGKQSDVMSRSRW